MLKIPGLEDEIPSEFPCKYLQAHEWGWSPREATKLFNRFDEWLFCARMIQKSGLIQKRKGVAFAVDPEHSQCRGTYDEHLQTVEERDHCDGPVLHLRRDGSTPEEVIKLADKLTEYLRTMQGYEGRTVNYISIMKYVDHEVGIDWHKHNEDDGCDTPTFIVSTGAERPFHIARIQKGWPPVPNPAERWSRMAEHGSLIIIPASFNNTHWHAILPESYPCGVRISVNTKCLLKPRVFSIKRKHPRFAKYVGCKYGKYEGTVYGNDHEPFKGHYTPIARNEEDFRLYAEKKMLDPEFRAQAIKDLRGKHLLCWCIQDGPERRPFCHARVWLDIVNRPVYAK